MPSLFLIGNPDITSTALESNKNTDFHEILTILNNESNNFDKIFKRKLVLNDLDDLLLQIYRDRLLPLPNSFNYETGVTLVVYSSKKIVPKMSIRQLNNLFGQYFPTLNVNFIDLDSLNYDETIENFNKIEKNLCIIKNRVLKMNHWMNHSDEHCSSNIYSMLKQLKSYSIENNKTDDNNSNNHNEPIPRIIRNIQFDQLIKDDKDEEYYLNLLSTWNFSALQLSTIELIQCGFYLIKHLSNLANIPITDNKLYLLLITIELSYHQINKFHNFRHCIDVMQACWQICERLIPSDHLTKLLLALAATGHDIGHPGTNNLLFKSSNNEIIDNSSILEAFHYNIFSHILGSHWNKINKLSENTKDNLIENGILATDMSLHSSYVKLLTERKNRNDLTSTELISVIVKAADISNVTRPLDISAKWALLITLEFKDCALLQDYYKENSNSTNVSNCFEIIETPPFKDQSIKSSNIDMESEIKVHNILSEPNCSPDKLIEEYPMIPNGQIFFIDTFAFEFFDKLAIIFPELRFLVDNISNNKSFWLSKEASKKDK